MHTQLTIILNGENSSLPFAPKDPAVLAIPGDVGAVKNADGSPKCTYALQTFGNTGVIHVKAPAPGTFTLGQFFDLWGQPLTSTNVAGLVGLPIVVYLSESDGTTAIVADHWQDIELKPHRIITIQVGSPIKEIPNFTWTGP